MEETNAAPPPAINFEIGGQVKTSAVSVSGAAGDSFNFVGSITSLDLDDVQPPSEMDGISYMMAGTHRLDSPQMSSLRNRRGLPSTLVARRAIAGHASHGLMRSVESVASHSNLENVAPPSLMDELLDSMISVDSITSEVAPSPADTPLKRVTVCGQTELSHYETALSDNEDTMTLRSCHELPLDADGSSSNCSSTLGTPVKRRQGSVTPKMKREMAKDRYKTYTVKVPGTEPERDQVQVVPTQAKQLKEEEEEEEETSPPGGKTPTPEKALRLSAKQRRQENRSRFQTQILDYSEMKIFEIAPKGDEAEQKREKEILEELALQAHEEPMEVVQDEEQEEKRKVTATTTTTTVIKKTLLKLIKPSSAESPPSTDTNNKTVRGRRKPDYVSPYRRPVTATPQSPGKVKGGSVAVSGQKMAPANGAIKVAGQQQQQPQIQQKKPGFISKLKMATKKSPTKEAKKQESPPQKELNRQGTFTKDEPCNENIPKVSSLPATPSKRVSKLPLVGNGVRKSLVAPPSSSSSSNIVPRNGMMKRQISAPATGNLTSEKRKSLIAAPGTANAVRTSNGQLSERSTSSASIKTAVAASGIKTPNSNKGTEKKLPLSMPSSRSNSTMGSPRTPTGTTPTSRISLYGRAKGLIPVSAKK